MKQAHKQTNAPTIAVEKGTFDDTTSRDELIYNYELKLLELRDTVKKKECEIARCSTTIAELKAEISHLQNKLNSIDPFLAPDVKDARFFRENLATIWMMTNCASLAAQEHGLPSLQRLFDTFETILHNTYQNPL